MVFKQWQFKFWRIWFFMNHPVHCIIACCWGWQSKKWLFHAQTFCPASLIWTHLVRLLNWHRNTVIHSHNTVSLPCVSVSILVNGFRWGCARVCVCVWGAGGFTKCHQSEACFWFYLAHFQFLGLLLQIKYINSALTITWWVKSVKNLR